MNDRPSASPSARPGYRHPWQFKLVAILLPFALLAAVELGMRLAGSYKVEADEWQNPHVEFEKGIVFFPDWNKQIARPKPAGTFRVFALGGSTTVGFGVAHAYPELLAAELNDRSGGRRVEVINGGVPAAGSHRLFEVLKEAKRFDPDLVLVFVGHNEFLEDVFFASNGVIRKQQKLRRFVRQFRVVRCLSDVFDISGWAHKSFRRASLQRHFLCNFNFPLIRTPEQYRTRLAFTESNFELMVGFAGEHRFRIVLMPEVANLMAPPGDSVHGPGFQTPDQWSALVTEGQRRLAQREYDAALTALQQAADLDPAYAMTHFVIAQALIAKGDLHTARKELELANSLDRRGDRINEDIRQTIAAVATRTGTPLLDLQADLYDQPINIHGPFGQKLFLDHCHPTEAGHRILTQRILRFLADKKLVPGLDPISKTQDR